MSRVCHAVKSTLEFFVATALWAVDESIEVPFFRRLDTGVTLRSVKFQIPRELVNSPLQFQELSQLLMSAHDEPLSVAMCVLLVLLVAVENGCN